MTNWHLMQLDEDEYYTEPHTSTTKTCKFCKQSNLYWGIHNGKWRLFTENDVLHTCKHNERRKMVIYCDIDSTICVRPGDKLFHKSTPLVSRIKKMNELYDEGYEIVYWTARPSALRKLTVSQLDEWGVKYHSLKLDKPLFDVFIDNRAFNATILGD